MVVQQWCWNCCNMSLFFNGTATFLTHTVDGIYIHVCVVHQNVLLLAISFYSNVFDCYCIIIYIYIILYIYIIYIYIYIYTCFFCHNVGCGEIFSLITTIRATVFSRRSENSHTCICQHLMEYSILSGCDWCWSWYLVLCPHLHCDRDEAAVSVPYTNCINISETFCVFTPDHLSPCYKYTFTVIPYSGAGQGQRSKNVMVTLDS